MYKLFTPYRLLRFFQILILISIFNSCHEKDKESIPEENVVNFETKIISHKAGGGVRYSGFIDNSLDGAKYGFANADGIEIDIQKSKDNTLWLYHDQFFYECDSSSQIQIVDLTDEEIINKGPCQGYTNGLTKLEEIFIYHTTNHLNKKISLDIKTWLPSDFLEAPFYLFKVADEIVDLTNKYNMTSYVMVECPYADFLKRIKHSNQDIECYLTTFDDFDLGLSNAQMAGLTGLSYKYNTDIPPSSKQMESLREKGLKIQFWTINEKYDILKAKDLKPDYLQTDNILMK